MGSGSSADRIAQVLFGAVRREVLALLYGRPDERFYYREILRAARGGSGAAQRELRQLVEAGLVNRVRDGHQVYFSANRESPVFDELQAIVRKTAGVADVVRAMLTPLIRRHIKLAFVYGSVARGRQTSESDIDLLAVGDVTLADLLPAVRSAEARLGREINPSVYTVREFRQKVRSGAPFIRRVIAGPKLFVIGDESVLGKLAR